MVTLVYRHRANGTCRTLPTLPPPMQPDAPSPAACSARRAVLRVEFAEIDRALAELGYSYQGPRVRHAFAGTLSYPRRVLAASWEALDKIEEEIRRRAADGDREAQDILDGLAAVAATA